MANLVNWVACRKLPPDKENTQVISAHEAIGVVVLITALGMLLAPALRLFARERRLDSPKRRHGFNNQLSPVEFEKRNAMSLHSVQQIRGESDRHGLRVHLEARRDKDGVRQCSESLALHRPCLEETDARGGVDRAIDRLHAADRWRFLKVRFGPMSMGIAPGIASCGSGRPVAL